MMVRRSVDNSSARIEHLQAEVSRLESDSYFGGVDGASSPAPAPAPVRRAPAPAPAPEPVRRAPAPVFEESEEDLEPVLAHTPEREPDFDDYLDPEPAPARRRAPPRHREDVSVDELRLAEARMQLARQDAESLRASSSPPPRGQKEDIDLLKKRASWIDASGLVQKYRRYVKGSRSVVANFELMNGHHTVCLVVVDEHGAFTFRGKTYITDDSLKYWNSAFKEWVYDYHESFTMPIRRKIPLNEMNLAMQQTNAQGVSFATNPTTLRTFLTNNVVQSAIQGASITNFFKQIRLLALVAAIAAVIHLLLWANEAGLFNSLKGG